MQLDNTTFNDLSIFHAEEEFSIFHKLNFTRTTGGRDWLIRFFSEPLNEVKRIKEVQQLLLCIAGKEADWPSGISNGTVMVLERFYDTPVDTIPSSANLPSAFMYKVLHGPDYALTRYSIGHFADFIAGFNQLIAAFDNDQTPRNLRTYIQRAAQLLKAPTAQELGQTGRATHYSPVQTIRYGHFLLYRFKSAVQELIDIYSRLDAWYSMAMAVKKFRLAMPEFVEAPEAIIDAKGLYHTLLPTPVAYDVRLDARQNFLFLTGANMAGKSTFIKSVGAAVYLAHLGMGVPAQQ
ncbi:MAG: DNA mismatch repair protein MutS, partial [Bacteroidetes bacterium]|nr:DNA mismatch repair protein MutS [Bacteroidota bacterium]